MKQIRVYILLTLLLSVTGTMAFPYDISVENADGVMICYNYRENGLELEVTANTRNKYSGNVTIPEEVTYLDRTRKVTAIGSSAFKDCSDLTSVAIPATVTYIGWQAFQNCTGLTSITIPEGVISIDYSAFAGCSGLTSMTIPNSVRNMSSNVFLGCSRLTSLSIGKGVTSIGEGAFYLCDALTSVYISDLAAWCKIDLASFTSNPLTTAHHLYLNGEEIKDELTVPDGVTTISNFAFSGCRELTSIVIGNDVTNIGYGAFLGCSGLTSITIGKNIISIGQQAFIDSDLSTVISQIENPFEFMGRSSGWSIFNDNSFYNATLFVPAGTTNKYKDTNGWKDFVFMEESGEKPETPTCEAPVISYQTGSLTFTSATEEALCVCTVKTPDVGTFISNSHFLSATYYISVYATKDGYNNSDTVKATLCWIDSTPIMKGITNDIASVRAMPVIIQNRGNILTLKGVSEGTPITVYDTAGNMVGSANAYSETTSISTSLRRGDIGIVKIGDKAVKVITK
jgi:hypothetical protein